MTPIKTPTLLYILAIVLFYYIEEGVQTPTTIRLLENAVCQQYYAKVGSDHLPVDEALCKISPIQDRLAMVRGWFSFWTTLPVVCVGTYYSNLADKVGRRKILSLAILGMICGLGWVFVVCQFWHSLPVELVWLNALCRCIGGGPFVVIALYMTMVSDLCTDDNRNQYLYIVYAFKLSIEMFAPLIASVSLQHSLWLSYLICGLSLLLIFPAIAIMPETLGLQANDDSSDTDDEPFSYMSFYTNKAVFICLIADLFLQFRYNTLQILIPFASVRFGLAIKEAAKLLSIIPGAGLVLFVALPLLSELFLRRTSMSSTSFNVYVFRTIVSMLVLGAVLISVSTHMSTLIFGLIVFAFGFGTRAPVLGYVSAHINSARDTARLYTLISILDAIVHMVGSPLIEILWARGLAIGGSGLTLPFTFSALVYLAGLVITYYLPFPLGVKTSVEDDTNGEQALLLPNSEDTGNDLTTPDENNNPEPGSIPLRS